MNFIEDYILHTCKYCRNYDNSKLICENENPDYNGKRCKLVDDSINRMVYEGWMSHKWGLQYKLPNEHPFKDMSGSVDFNVLNEYNEISSFREWWEFIKKYKLYEDITFHCLKLVFSEYEHIWKPDLIILRSMND